MLKNTRKKLAVAIASTALSYGAIATLEAPKAEAAVLTYSFKVGLGNGSFTFDNSSITGIGFEDVTISEGTLSFFYEPRIWRTKKEYNLAGEIVRLYKGELVGLIAQGKEVYSGIVYGDGRSDSYLHTENWEFHAYGHFPVMSWSTNTSCGTYLIYCGIIKSYDNYVIYSKVSEQPSEPLTQVPEPLTMAGTALAFASLVRLKQKKKIAVRSH